MPILFPKHVFLLKVMPNRHEAVEAVSPFTPAAGRMVREWLSHGWSTKGIVFRHVLSFKGAPKRMGI